MTDPAETLVDAGVPAWWGELDLPGLFDVHVHFLPHHHGVHRLPVELAPFPSDLLPGLRDLQGKILLGSDFPNIPYPYAPQLEALARLELENGWLRDVCWYNGLRLFDTPTPRPTEGPA